MKAINQYFERLGLGTHRCICRLEHEQDGLRYNEIKAEQRRKTFLFSPRFKDLPDSVETFLDVFHGGGIGKPDVIVAAEGQPGHHGNICFIQKLRRKIG